MRKQTISSYSHPKRTQVGWRFVVGLWVTILPTTVRSLSVGSCVVSMGRSDSNQDGQLSRIEFNSVVLDLFEGCEIDSNTSELVDMIFEDAACACQLMEASSPTCCINNPVIYRPGRYPNNYTRHVCEIVLDAIDLFCVPSDSEETIVQTVAESSDSETAVWGSVVGILGFLLVLMMLFIVFNSRLSKMEHSKKSHQQPEPVVAEDTARDESDSAYRVESKKSIVAQQPSPGTNRGILPGQIESEKRIVVQQPPSSAEPGILAGHGKQQQQHQQQKYLKLPSLEEEPTIPRQTNRRPSNSQTSEPQSPFDVIFRHTDSV